MKPKALMLSAAVLLASTAVVFAQANSPPTTTQSSPGSSTTTQQMNNSSPPAAQPAANAPAPSAAQSSKQPSSTDMKQAQSRPPRTSKHRVMAAHRMTRRYAEHDRATTALNVLEDKGYRDFSSFRPDGRDYEITAQKSGKTVTVVVNPDTKSVRTQG